MSRKRSSSGHNLHIIVLLTLVLSNASPVVSLGADPENRESNTNRSGNVQAVPRQQIQEISREIDRLIEESLAQKDLVPNDQVSDEVFLRRAYLDIAGRIPTYTETTRFLADESPEKRSHLIDELLDSKAFESHQFNYFADLLRLKSRLRNIPGQPYIDFVKESIQQNRPYDEFVRELITASGNYAEQGHGAVGYYLRDFGMPEDNMSNTIRVFLGTRLECAQCHDHPFDVWTQKDYFEMVAFTGGVLMRVEPPIDDAAELRQMQRKGNLPEDARRRLRQILQPLGYGVQGSGTGLARLPKDYQANDGEPNQVVTARTMFEKKELVIPQMDSPKDKGKRRGGNNRNRSDIRGAKHVDSRQAYAEWLTSPDNPRFTTVIANRMWKRAMGVGLIEPVDVMTDETVASHPALMEYLTEQMVALDYDLKQFLRAIYNTKTYQRSACLSDSEPLETYSFRGPLLRRLTAEQLWDSLMTLAVDQIDDKSGPGNSNRSYAGMSLQELYEKAKGMSADDFLKLATMSREELRKKQRQASPAVSEMEMRQRNKQRAQFQQLRKQQQLARRNGDQEQVAKIKQQMQAMMQADRQRQTRGSADMVRASELSSPARPGHLLGEFGQSDRETIENSHQEPSVSQVLSLMNGYIETQIASNRGTQLMIQLDRSPTIAEKIDTAFLSLLNRYPTAEEKQIWLDEAATHGDTVESDLIWTLVNNSEFLFIQ